MKTMLKNIYELLKTILMIILFISVIILASIYIIQTQRLALARPIDISMKSLLIVKKGESASTEFNKNHVNPIFIGYKYKGNSISKGSFSADIINDIYNSISVNIIKLLSNSSECKIIYDNPSGHWNDIINNKTYIYIKYQFEIPSKIIYSYFTNEILIDNNEIAAGGIIFIKDILLVLENAEAYKYSYSMAVRDSNGNVAEYTIINNDGSDDNYFDINKLSNYNAELIDYNFYIDQPIVYSNIILNNETILIDNNLNLKTVTVTDNILNINNDEIIKVFGYNPARINTYMENDNKTTVYVELHKNLKISEDGIIEFNYTEESNGIEISEFLNYKNSSGEYTIYETLLSISNFINIVKGIDNSLLGGDAGLCLKSIQNIDNNIIIEFCYTFDNIVFYNSEYIPITACRFIINNFCFKEIKINNLTVIDVHKKKISFSQDWTIRNINSSIAAANTSDKKYYGDVQLAYVNLNSDNNELIPEWIFIYKE